MSDRQSEGSRTIELSLCIFATGISAVRIFGVLRRVRLRNAFNELANERAFDLFRMSAASDVVVGLFELAVELISRLAGRQRRCQPVEQFPNVDVPLLPPVPPEKSVPPND